MPRSGLWLPHGAAKKYEAEPDHSCSESSESESEASPPLNEPTIFDMDPDARYMRELQFEEEVGAAEAASAAPEAYEGAADP
eukprot:3038142-Alexandrium_andersonii.AAC.1